MARYYDGAWQKIIYVVLADKSLPAKNTFECEMVLPHTSIKEIKTIFYAPSKISNAYFKNTNVLLSLYSKWNLIWILKFLENPTVMASASNSCPSRCVSGTSITLGLCLMFVSSILTLLVSLEPIRLGVEKIEWTTSYGHFRWYLQTAIIMSRHKSRVVFIQIHVIR